MTVRRRDLLRGMGAGAAGMALSGCRTFAPGLGLPLSVGEDRAAAVRARMEGIDHLVVVMMENRSFDHYFGALALDRGYPGRGEVEGLSGAERNLDTAGRPVAPGRLLEDRTVDPPHHWDASHAQYHGGLNDAFVRCAERALCPDPRQVMGYYDRERLPVLYALADQYTVCDHWFSSVMGSTWPNRFYLHATTSWSLRSYQPNLDPGAVTLWDLMRQRGVPARYYRAGLLPWFAGAFLGKTVANSGVRARPLEEFFADARKGELPAFSMVEPDFFFGDDHPPHHVSLGQAFIGTVARALGESPCWPRSLLLVTYDEHGGFFDHVAPPATVDVRSDFAQLGFRVPTLLVGPRVRPGHVHAQTLEHVSVAATLACRLGLPALTARMANAPDFAAAIRPPGEGAPLPPPRLPALGVRRRDVAATVGMDSQPELTRLAREIPVEHLDPRPAMERFRGWLRAAEEFEVVRVTG
ncbi:MAG TPA: alkaline phosphatase family protein [Myxococcales bacterium]|nr:alkaline phosphatase family protein [Myxococcales bacterium]